MQDEGCVARYGEHIVSVERYNQEDGVIEYFNFLEQEANETLLNLMTLQPGKLKGQWYNYDR